MLGKHTLNQNKMVCFTEKVKRKKIHSRKLKSILRDRHVLNPEKSKE
jgi:hypothetical protein